MQPWSRKTGVLGKMLFSFLKSLKAQHKSSVSGGELRISLLIQLSVCSTTARLLIKKQELGGCRFIIWHVHIARHS